MTHLHLVNTLPIDLPDLYEGIEDNVPDVSNAFVALYIFWAFALGVVTGVVGVLWW